jgi:RNA polymerase sigma-70 factor (ECF subfamily)
MDSGWLRKSSYEASADSPPWGHVTPLPFVGSDDELLEALRKGHPGAAKAFYDRYAEVVERVLLRIMGPVEDVPGLIEAAFLRAIAGASRLRDPGRLQGWVAAAAVGAARGHLRRRARGRVWARFAGHGSRTARASVDAPRGGDVVARAMHAMYGILDGMPVDERIVFALQILDAMPPPEIAEVTGASLGRLKRRSRRAEARFLTLARKHAVLGPWLDRGSRWSLPTLG